MTDYVVTVTDHMMVEREDGGPVRCGWDTLQALKDEYLGPEVCAVEVFPPESEVVNDVNRRHFYPVDSFKVPSLARRTNPCV